MRRVSTSLFTVAGFAALVAVPAAGAGAQVSPSSSNAANTHVIAEGTDCNHSGTAAYNANVSRDCTIPSAPTKDGPYSSAATSDVFAAISVKTHADFNGPTGIIAGAPPGSPGSTPVDVGATGIYYQYITFGSSVAAVEFTSAVTADASSDTPAAIASNKAHIDIGSLTPDDQFGANITTFGWTTGESTIDGTLLFSDLDNPSERSFYYTVYAESDVTDNSPDPMASANIFVIDPTILCFDETGAATPCLLSRTPPPLVTGTPEPASLALMGTGLVGVAGFARRKRRSASKA